MCGAGREGFVEAVDQVDAIDNRLEKKYKIAPKKGLIGPEELIDEREDKEREPFKEIFHKRSESSERTVGK